MPKIKDFTANGVDMEYLAGPVISGQMSYRFPVSGPVTQDFKFIVKRDGDTIWVDDLITNKEDDGFILGGAL